MRDHLRSISAEAACPRTWAEAICINIFLWCWFLLLVGFGG